MASAFAAQRAVRASAAFTTELLHHLPHRDLYLRSVAGLAWNYTDDPFAGAGRDADELRPVVDYERVTLLHGSPYEIAFREASEDVERLCHVWDRMGLVGTEVTCGESVTEQ
jgi:hypothetical protein